MIRALLATLGLWSALAGAAPTPEQQWLSAAEQFEQGQLTEAEKSLQALLKQQPNFRLARWLYGDLLAARSGKKLKPPAGSGDLKAQDLADEASLRLQGLRAPPPAGHLPDTLLQPSWTTRHIAVVDLSRARLHLIENKGGKLQPLRSHFVGIGRKGFGKQTQGDLRTPVGVYRITGFTPDSELPELYGAGSLPLDYPNLWDQRKKRSGSGIWLHGVPRQTYVRPPRSSEGCVTLSNEELLALKPYLLPGKTPVILSDKVNWVSPADLEAARKDFLPQIESWRQAWSSKNTARYLAYYAKDFISEDGMNLAQFTVFKRRVNDGKKYIKVALTEVEAYRYPGESNLVMVRFKQDYRSDNLSRVSRKQQLWRRNGAGPWGIVSEEML